MRALTSDPICSPETTGSVEVRAGISQALRSSVSESIPYA